MLKAIIYDFDGVIADTEPTHLRGFQTVLKALKVDLTDEQYYDKYLAYDDRRLFTEILKDNDKSYDEDLVNELIKSKHEIMQDLFDQHLELFPGFLEFLDLVKDRYIISIASGALKTEIIPILRRFGIENLFNNITAAEDVTNCKPDPEAFNLALETINSTTGNDIVPSECLVFEDSVHGVEAAKAANMICCAITNSYSHNSLSQADLIVKGFGELSIERIEQLFN